MRIHQDAHVYRLRLNMDQAQALPQDLGANAWVQVAKGSLQTEGLLAIAGDAFVAENHSAFALTATEDSEALVFFLS